MVAGKAKGDRDGENTVLSGATHPFILYQTGSHSCCEQSGHAPQKSSHVHLTSQPSVALEQELWQSLCVAVVFVGSEGAQVVG